VVVLAAAARAVIRIVMIHPNEKMIL